MTLKALTAGVFFLLAGPEVRAADLTEAQAAYAAGDFAKASLLFRVAAEQGDPLAQYNLGVLYESGQGLPKDYAAAALWYRKGADQGYAEAQNNLANMYTFGLGVPLDLTEAVKWLRLAAQQGSSGAQFNLGLMYTLGQGVPKDNKMAEAWLRLAATQGMPDAQYNLGVMFEKGDGVAADPAEAYCWYAAAADQGFPQAAEKKAKLSASMTPDLLAQGEKKAAAIKAAMAQASGGKAEALPTPSRKPLAAVAALALGACAAAAAWAVYRRKKTPAAASAPAAAGFSPVPYETILRGVKDPLACEKVSRYYFAGGKAQEFVSQNQDRPSEFYGAYGRGFLKAGHYAAALALLKMKPSPDPEDDKLIWTLEKAICEQPGVAALSYSWPWTARLGLAEELSAQGMNAEALAVADDVVLAEAAKNPADADRAAALFNSAGASSVFASERAAGKTPEFRAAYADAFNRIGDAETSALLAA